MEKPLDKLTLKGFKSIKSLQDFTFKNLNIVIGSNGAGKSNLVEFFRVLSAMMKPDGLKEYIGRNADMFLFGGPKETPSIEVKMSFRNNGYDFDLAPTEDGHFSINHETVSFRGEGYDRPYTQTIGSGNATAKVSEVKKKHKMSGYVYEAITSWQIYHFHDTSKTSGMRRYHDANHHEKLKEDASNIAPFLLNLKQHEAKAYQEIISAVKLVIPFFEDFILQSNGNEQVRLQWQQKGLNDFPMKPSLLSDGSIRFIALATALLQPTPPSAIIIDEPELGLHPHAIEILAELLKNAAQKTQVIVSTQSPELISQFAIEDIIVANRKDGASTFQRLKKKDFSVWLEDYSIGELWTKNIIEAGAKHE